MLRRAATLGMALPFAAAALNSPLAAQSGPSLVDFRKNVEDVVARSGTPELVDYRLFEINGADLPWINIGLDAMKGQQVTFLITGRWWISRDRDLWFRPGLGFHIRTHGQRPIFSPGTETTTITLSHDGPIEMARLASLTADEDGRLTIPVDAYRKADVKITGVALLWRGDAAAGLARLAGNGSEVDGLVAAELRRLELGRRLPDGWSNLFLLGGGEEHFARDANGDIVCESAGSASIIQRPLSLPFLSKPKLGWRWKVDQLPSALPVDQAAVHDYLSIGVKFEDGQDLTYIWSAALPLGKVFRRPLPGWDAVETHMVVDSGVTMEANRCHSEPRTRRPSALCRHLLFRSFRLHLGPGMGCRNGAPLLSLAAQMNRRGSSVLALRKIR